MNLAFAQDKEVSFRYATPADMGSFIKNVGKDFNNTNQPRINKMDKIF